MKPIEVQFIPANQQRYPTSGDYKLDNNLWEFRISQFNDDYRFLVLLHEMVEWYLVVKRGIKIKDIDKFDMKLAKEHPELEPGDQPEAPYYKEHQFASGIERIMAAELGVDWQAYDKSFEELNYGE